jgi:hypothetical protein
MQQSSLKNFDANTEAFFLRSVEEVHLPFAATPLFPAIFHGR